MMTCYCTPQHDRTLRVPASACQRPVRVNTCRPVFGMVCPQPRAGQRTMLGVLPNERLLPTPFKNVSTNLYVSKLKLPSSVRPQTTRASRPRIFACPTHLPPRLCGARPPLKTNRKEVATFSSKRSHQKGAPNTGTQQSTSSTPCKRGGATAQERACGLGLPDNRPAQRCVHLGSGCVMLLRLHRGVLLCIRF